MQFIIYDNSDTEDTTQQRAHNHQPTESTQTENDTDWRSRLFGHYRQTLHTNKPISVTTLSPSTTFSLVALSLEAFKKTSHKHSIKKRVEKKTHWI